ncbi:hypothetical protein [Sorangium sp. So ce1182]|uniref:hypothetical protein n=1 Tax=Sorangium sp. So ce1182 TaxID=3133334 RepID=UPI003F5D797F
MRRANFIAFDEFVPLGTNSSAPVFTSAELNSKLGHFDQLAIMVVIDNVGGSTVGGFELFIEHSGDGRNFLAMKTNTSPPTGTGDISISSLSTTATNVKWGKHDGGDPLLNHVRFRLYFTNTTTSAHVRVIVTQRDDA